MQESSQPSGACPEFESHVSFYAADELEGAERDSLEEHLDQCAAAWRRWMRSGNCLR